MFARVWQRLYDPLGEDARSIHIEPGPEFQGEAKHADRLDVALPALDDCSQGIYVRDGQLYMSIPELYHRLQNLSHYPHAVPLARRFYLGLLSRHVASSSDGILSLPSRFDPAALQTWLCKVGEATTAKFERYVARRRAGGDREMFRDRQDAVRWCRESAVVKYVDGAWIHGVYRCTTSGAAHDAARITWQVLSEELGDGNLERSHVAAYERLMDDLGDAPGGFEREMISWLEEDGEQPNKQPWIAALLQLCASISPSDFLPEILGFNLSYESLPLHLLITSRELKELRIDPYYFILHISIDNGHSGHSAVARMAVEDYLLDAEISHGVAHADLLWRRVQAGYVLADSVRTTPRTSQEPPSTPMGWDDSIPIASDEIGDPSLAKAVLQLFKEKAAATIGLHAASRAMIGDRPISHWLDPNVLETDGEQFMTVMANSKAWIKPGCPEESRFYKATGWGGKMFGAFTRGETTLLHDWIQGLGEGHDYTLRLGPTARRLEEQTLTAYSNFLGNRIQLGDLAPLDLSGIIDGISDWEDWEVAAPKVYAAVLAKPDALRHWQSDFPFNLSTTLTATSAHDVFKHLDPSNLSIDPAFTPVLLCMVTAPLEWISCSYPAKLNSPMGMCLIKVLRILYDFTESPGGEGGCMGIDDVVSAQPGVRELFPNASMDPAGQRLALPALILALNSRPEVHLPVLLGITSALVCVLNSPSVKCDLEADKRERLDELVRTAKPWLVKAIDLGFASPKLKVWKGTSDEWGRGLALGVSLALRGL